MSVRMHLSPPVNNKLCNSYTPPVGWMSFQKLPHIPIKYHMCIIKTCQPLQTWLLIRSDVMQSV